MHSGTKIVCNFDWSPESWTGRKIQKAEILFYISGPDADSATSSMSEYTITALTESGGKLTSNWQIPSFYKDWARFDITSTLQKLAKKDPSRLLFTLHCSKCRKENGLGNVDIKDFQPYIQITAVPKVPRSRTKRAVEHCDDNTSGCCNRPLRIYFNEIDWADWVIAPNYFNANFCHGKCIQDSQFSTAHRTIVSTLRRKKGRRWFFSSCCVATKHTAINILYLGEDGIIYLKEISNMSVEECGCA